MNRRHFLAAGTASALTGLTRAEVTPPKPLFQISLAQWSHHRTLRAKTITNLEWPKYSKENFGIHALEYVNSFFKRKAEDTAYLADLNQRVNDLGMTNLLIMIDGEGKIGEETEAGRQKTVDKHKRWVTAAKTLGCHSIRVNAHATGDTPQEHASRCIKGLTKLSEFAQDHDINILVENHGGLSSNGIWMSQVLQEVAMENCGSLPDFGNFEKYDRYQGLKDLMPFAKGVSAKSNTFDDLGNETQTDFKKALKIVLDHHYHGHIGIEFAGKNDSEDEGIRKTQTLLEKCRSELAG